MLSLRSVLESIFDVDINNTNDIIEEAQRFLDSKRYPAKVVNEHTLEFDQCPTTVYQEMLDELKDKYGCEITDIKVTYNIGTPNSFAELEKHGLMEICANNLNITSKYPVVVGSSYITEYKNPKNLNIDSKYIILLGIHDMSDCNLKCKSLWIRAAYQGVTATIKKCKCNAKFLFMDYRDAANNWWLRLEDDEKKGINCFDSFNRVFGYKSITKNLQEIVFGHRNAVNNGRCLYKEDGTWFQGREDKNPISIFFSK